MKRDARLDKYYSALFDSLGPQGWWPARTRFEVIVGAILTQNTAWTNVERAIKNLKRARVLTTERMHEIETELLAALIRPSGYFNQKARKLKDFLGFLYKEHGGRLERLFSLETGELRLALLALRGIGPETADSIMLYAAARPVFVIDAYTKRIFERHGLLERGTGYAEAQELFMASLAPDAQLFNQYHALIVKTGKDFCRPRTPLCGECPLKAFPKTLNI